MSMPEDAHQIYRRYLSAVALHGNASAAAMGLGGTDLQALGVLNHEGPMTSGELAAALGLTTGATTRLIDRLERDGHARRVPDPADRRKVMVESTGKRTELDEALRPGRTKVKEIFDSYSDQELRVLFDYFTRATTAYEEASAELRRRVER